MRIAFLLSVLCLTSFSTHAREVPLRLVTEEFAPFNFRHDGDFVGISVDIVTQVLERAEIPYSLEILPWARAYTAAELDRDTAIFTMARNSEREGKFLWLGKISDRQISLYRHVTRDDLEGVTISSLGDQTIAVTKNDASHMLLKSLGVPDQNIVLSTVEGGTDHKLVMLGRADFIVRNRFNFRWKAASRGEYGQYVEHQLLHSGDGYYLAANRGTRSVWVERIQKVFAEMEASDEIGRIVESWLVPPGPLKAENP